VAFTTIILKQEGGVTVLTLNRPERLNAMNEQMVADLKEALEQIGKDDGVRALVVTGAGRAFCAGADVSRGESREKILDETNPERVRQGIRTGPQEVTRRLRNLEKPVIAMVNGPAIGAGLDWSLACDIRYASENARFGAGFTRIGLIQGTGGFWLLPRLMGSARAAEFIFTAEIIDAREAERLGMVNRVLKPEDLEKETLSLAQRLAKMPPLAVKLSKLLLYRGLETGLDQALEMAAAMQPIVLNSQDHKEGLAAFREKREPVFKGR